MEKIYAYGMPRYSYYGQPGMPPQLKPQLLLLHPAVLTNQFCIPGYLEQASLVVMVCHGISIRGGLELS